MLNELFVEVMLFMDRDSLDSMQLACRFMLDYIHEHEAMELALRPILTVTLGETWGVGGLNPGEKHYWLPHLRLRLGGQGDYKSLIFNCVHELLPHLRLAYC